MPLERYSPDARLTVELATQEARQLGHRQVGTEHLLLGLLAQQGTAAASALGAGGASLALCREKVTEALATRSTGGPPGAGEELPFSDRARRALDRASRLAPRMGSEVVLPEHLLLSVLDVEGTAGQVLRGQAVDLTAVRQALSSPHRTVAASKEPGVAVSVAGPLCGNCGSLLEETLGQAKIGSAGLIVLYCTGCGVAIGAAASPNGGGTDRRRPPT